MREERGSYFRTVNDSDSKQSLDKQVGNRSVKKEI